MQKNGRTAHALDNRVHQGVIRKSEIIVTKAETVASTQITADPMMLAARFALGLSCLVAVVTLAAAVYTYALSLSANRSPLQPLAQSESQSSWSTPIFEMDATDAGEPVVFANPFDKSEVFEFPEGTTEAEARAAVTEILMERARERYAQLDAASHKRR